MWTERYSICQNFEQYFFFSVKHVCSPVVYIKSSSMENKMNYALARDYYMKKQTSTLVSEATAHELISLTLQQLVKNLEQYNRADSRTMSLKYKTQALVAIYTLQSSLDFEQGGEIARNLFRLYEFVKSSLSEANEQHKYKVEQSLKLMSEILEAWEEIK